MFGLHPIDLIIILVVALLVFGPKRLPELGSGVGKFIREFRKGVNDLSNPKEDRNEAIKSPSYEAIERENASKKVNNDFQSSSVNPDGEMAGTTTGDEPVHDSRVD